MKLPPPPAEVPACRDMDRLAPQFRAKIEDLLAELRPHYPHARVAETVRTDERQAYLYGFGRDYDDDRGIVTNAPTATTSWHRFGLAVDIEGVPAAVLEETTMAHGLTSGSDWNRNGIHDEHLCDAPHVQWFCAGMHVSPSDHARALLAAAGVEAVWRELHAA
jgi:hypothetical protein